MDKIINSTRREITVSPSQIRLSVVATPEGLQINEEIIPWAWLFAARSEAISFKPDYTFDNFVAIAEAYAGLNLRCQTV